MLAHQRLEYLRPRQQAEAFAEAGAAAQLREGVLVRERARLQLVHAEEVTELGVLAVENRPRLPHCVLPARERVDAHRVVVPRPRLGVVAYLKAELVEPVRELDVLPRRGRKRRVERMLGEELPVDGDVRRVEEVERSEER